MRIIRLLVISIVVSSAGCASVSGLEGASAENNSTSNKTAPSIGQFLNETFSKEPINRSAIEHQIHHFINEERAERGLNPISFTEDLREVARYHSRDMADGRYFAHESPSGQDFAGRYEKFGIDCSVRVSPNMKSGGAENIAYTYADSDIRTDDGRTINHERNETKIARGLVNQWMNSPGHQENILQSYWNNEGIGIAITEDEEGRTIVYATQNFC